MKIVNEDDGKWLLNLGEIECMLAEIGVTIDTPATIIAVGGYCMLLYKARESTLDVDFIPSSSDFVVPKEYREFLNYDIMNLCKTIGMNINYSQLEPYCLEQRVFGNLTVKIAGIDMLYAMKVVAKNNRMQERDSLDLLWLHERANKETAHKIWQLLTGESDSYDDWCADRETDIYIFRREVALAEEDPFDESNYFQ